MVMEAEGEEVGFPQHIDGGALVTEFTFKYCSIISLPLSGKVSLLIIQL